MSVDQKINQLSEKLQQLLKHYNQLKRENDWLKNEVQKFVDQQASHSEKVSELQQQIAIVKLASSEMNEKDKKNFEKTMNQYIKEIDQCIAFLSQ
ncbi:MAG: hypothetical protein NVS1B13_09390 [Flavisolibacter sp.]